MTASFLDKVLLPIAPSYALKRVQSRRAFEVLSNYKERRFDGASKQHRFQGWKRPNTSADSAISGNIISLRNGSRDLTRNNPWAKKALQVIANNTIGTGINGQVVSKNKKENKKLNEMWQQWAKSTDIDVDGKMNIVGLQNLVINAVAESGEVLIRKVVRNTIRSGKIPFQLQILEPDFIDSFKNSLPDGTGNYIKDGIEYNNKGVPVGYYIYSSHPGELKSYNNYSYQSVFHPASEIIHVYDKTRAGQTRGYPWCAAAIRRLKDYDDYEDAQLVRQKIAAMFVGFIRDMNTNGADSTGLSDTADVNDNQIEHFQPGMFETLGPDKDVTFSTPPSVSNYDEYSKNILRGVAAAYGVTYEALTGDYEKVNFSSAKLARDEFHKNLTKWQNIVIQGQMLEGVANWFFDAAEIMGSKTTGCSFKWTNPRREMIDPTREIPAIIKGIRGGLMSLSNTHTQLGYDSDQVLDEIYEMNKKLDLLGITIDTDPRKVNSWGGELESMADEGETKKTKDEE